MTGRATTRQTSGGIGLGGILFVVFLVLKLTGVPPAAGWSWWWVTAPLWIPFLAMLLVLAMFLACVAVGRVLR